MRSSGWRLKGDIAKMSFGSSSMYAYYLFTAWMYTSGLYAMKPEVRLYMLYSNAISIPEILISFLRLDPTTTTTPVPWRPLEPPPHRLNHPPEPIKIQHAQRRVADHVRRSQPRRHRQSSRRLECGPDVLVHAHALVGAPDQAAGGEGGDEGDTVDELGGGARHVELVHEPVDVEKGG